MLFGCPAAKVVPFEPTKSYTNFAAGYVRIAVLLLLVYAPDLPWSIIKALGAIAAAMVCASYGSLSDCYTRVPSVLPLHQPALDLEFSRVSSCPLNAWYRYGPSP